MTELKLRTAAWYGDREIQLDLPDAWQVEVHEPCTPPPLSDEQIRAAFESPIGQEPIRELARGRSGPCIVVDDLTRPTPAWRVMPEVLEQLRVAGIAPGQVTIVLAKGSHGPIAPGTWEKKIGCEAAKSCRLNVHEYDRDLVYRGRSSFGTPVFVNRAVADADLLIGIGGIYPQHSTGFGGGSKLALGVLGRRSIVGLHYGHASMEGSNEVLNTFRRDLDEIATMVGLRTVAAIHVDARRDIVRLVTGDHQTYYHECVNYSLAHYSAPPPDQADVVIANAYPQDVSLTFMRSKGLAPLVKAPIGASRVVISANSEGVGLHRLFPFLNAPRWDRQRQQFRRLSVRGPSLIFRSLSKWRPAYRHDSSTLQRRRNIHMYSTGPIPAELPGEVDLWSGSDDHLVAHSDWHELLRRVGDEQRGRDRPNVAVYSCASMQIIERRA
jgi:nickel-dependent lactate racemase